MSRVKDSAVAPPSVVIGDGQATRGRALCAALRKADLTAIALSAVDEFTRLLSDSQPRVILLDFKFAAALLRSDAARSMFAGTREVTVIVWCEEATVREAGALATTLRATAVLRPKSLAAQFAWVNCLFTDAAKCLSELRLDYTITTELRRCCAKVKDFHALVDGFTLDAETLLGDMGRHAAGGQMAALRQTLHQLRGSAASIGARQLLIGLNALDALDDVTLASSDLTSVAHEIATTSAALYRVE